MLVKKCKVCNGNLYNKPILVLNNMPKSAQNFPTKKDLHKEKGIKLSVYQCQSCGLVQLTDKPVNYYKQVIRAVGLSKEMQSFRQKQFKNFVTKYKLSNKNILEVGCGFGEYLSIMNRLNIDAYGIEYSQKAVNYCKSLGLKVSKQFVEKENYKIKDAPFNAFFIMSYLEHIPNINSFLRGINNNLTDGAIGLIEVPNFDMILNKKIFSEFILDHLFYFTKDTLKNALNINGFDVLECKPIWHNYILSAVVKKREKFDLTVFNKQQAILSMQLHQYINNFDKKTVAIWGAGHQALALISLSKIQNKINFIVDSASFKQNKFSPATHIPIYSPDILKTEMVKAIIIMAGSYSDEIFNIIKNKYNKNISIAILREDKLDIVN